MSLFCNLLRSFFRHGVPVFLVVDGPRSAVETPLTSFLRFVVCLFLYFAIVAPPCEQVDGPFIFPPFPDFPTSPVALPETRSCIKGDSDFFPGSFKDFVPFLFPNQPWFRFHLYRYHILLTQCGSTCAHPQRAPCCKNGGLHILSRFPGTPPPMQVVAPYFPSRLIQFCLCAHSSSRRERGYAPAFAAA